MQRGKIFRKGSSWHLRYKAYRISDGKKVWNTTSTKLADYDLRHRTQQSVEEDAEKFRRSLNPVTATNGANVGPTFKEQSEIWLDRCANRQRKPIKPATLKNWKSHLRVHILPVLQNVLIRDIASKAVKDLVADLSERLSANSVRNIVRVTKMVKASAIDEHGNELYPTKWNRDFIDMPELHEQRRPSFSSEQIEAIIKSGGRRMQMLVILLAATGLRAGEILGLEIRHFNGTSVKVEQAVWNGITQGPKTKNALRTVELYPSVAKLLKTFIGNRTTGYIFPNGGKKSIHQSNFLRREFHPLLKAAGIPKSGLHGFRRYRNTYLRNVVGCPDGLLKYWLGHSERDMSDRYDMVRDDAKFRQRQAKKMGVGFKLPLRLENAGAKSRKFVVRLVVRHSQSGTQNPHKPL